MESGEESNEEIEHGEEEESQEIGDINEESQETGDITSNLKEEEKPQNGLTAILEENVDIAGLSQPDSKRQRSNAKAVECFDMNGNLVGTFRSGLAANQALNIQQGDISLCCRGLKDNINGLRFRFAGEEHRANAIVRRGYVTEVVPVNILAAPPGEEDIPGRLVTRLSRQNRIDAEKEKLQKTSILAPAEIKARKWTLEPARFGSIVIKRWNPERETATEELQNCKRNMRASGVSKTKRKRSTGRMSEA